MTAQNRSPEQKKKPRGKPFQKGVSGNPGGRPKAVAEVRDAAREHTLLAIERLAFWITSGEPAASVAACKEMLDRGWGKSPTKFEDEEGNSGLTVIIKR